MGQKSTVSMYKFLYYPFYFFFFALIHSFTLLGFFTYRLMETFIYEGFEIWWIYMTIENGL